MEPTSTVHVWHDYVCPFSYIAATRIARIKEAEDLNLNLHFHPWPLEAANGAQPRAEEEDQWVQLLRAVEPVAFAGWDPSSGFWPASSGLLFAAYEAALAQNVSAAARFDLLARQRIFQHPQPVDTVETLSEPAEEAGLDVAALQAALGDGSAERRAREVAAGARNLGIGGIPTLVLPNGRQVLNPGLKTQQTEQGRVIRDDLDSLRELLRHAAAGRPVGTPAGL